MGRIINPKPVYPHEQFNERDLWEDIYNKRRAKKMIVNKPQFDTNKIEPGQAYWLTKYEYNKFKSINTPCIILKVQPLGILISYLDGKDKRLVEHHINIDDVVNKTFTLEKMTIEPKGA